MRESLVTPVVAPLKNILNHILRGAEAARGHRFRANLVERLPPTRDIRSDSLITFRREIGTHIGHATYPESVRPAVGATRTNPPAKPQHNLQHRRLPGANIAPKPKTFVERQSPLNLNAPIENIAYQLPVAAIDFKLRANFLCHFNKIKL